MTDSETASSRRPRPGFWTAGALTIAVLLAAAASAYAVTVGSRASTHEPIRRVVIGQSSHTAGAKGRTLGLSRVTIAPDAALDFHHHPGTQVSQVTRGTLTYWVRTGGVTVRRGDRVVRRIGPGQHGKIPAGDWIVEQPGTIHRGANLGNTRVVILIASLYRTGAPPSIPAG
jgi:quercetin dioxygenase-like cupin family protein